jgi:hypothetical protein
LDHPFSAIENQTIAIEMIGEWPQHSTGSYLQCKTSNNKDAGCWMLDAKPSIQHL